MFVPRINIKSRDDVVPTFEKMIKQVTQNSTIMNKARQYNNTCEEKYHGSMKSALDIIGKLLSDHNVKYLVQSSYSASVYIDNPGDVDLDIVALYDSEQDLSNLRTIVQQLGFMFLEERNTGLPHMIHYVYVRHFDSFVIELKLRQWENYKEHLYKIHTFLDSLPADTRIAWRYIRMSVMTRDDQTKKKVKYLWYMYGAIKTHVKDTGDYFPMNIYY